MIMITDWHNYKHDFFRLDTSDDDNFVKLLQPPSLPKLSSAFVEPQTDQLMDFGLSASLCSSPSSSVWDWSTVSVPSSPLTVTERSTSKLVATNCKSQETQSVDCLASLSRPASCYRRSSSVPISQLLNKDKEMERRGKPGLRNKRCKTQNAKSPSRNLPEDNTNSYGFLVAYDKQKRCNPPVSSTLPTRLNESKPSAQPLPNQLMSFATVCAEFGQYESQPSSPSNGSSSSRSSCGPIHNVDEDTPDLKLNQSGGSVMFAPSHPFLLQIPTNN